MGAAPPLLCWSGGKDSALALHRLLGEGRGASTLLTTLTEGFDRISMHGVRRELLERQVAALGLPLRPVYISRGAGNAEYESRMEEALLEQRERGVEEAAFGDIFLEDLRAYRERQLARIGMRGLFPLWKTDTAALAERFIALGFKAALVCVDTRALDASFAGAEFDRGLLRRLPRGVDPCGENGEFHSFVYDGPIFREPVRFARGESVLRDGRFQFFDLLPR